MPWARAVLFDLDYTLWHPGDAPDWQALNRAAARQLAPVLVQIGFDEAACLDLVEAFWRLFPDLQATAEHREVGLCDVLHALLRERSSEATRDLAMQARHALCLPAREVGTVLYEDSIETLDWLKGRGLGIGVVTNRLVWRQREDLRHLGLDQLVDVLVASEDVGFRKPHPAPFREALRRLGCTPSEALMVGDSYEVDVMGARAAGIAAVLKLNQREDRPEWQADFKLRQLRELRQVLDSNGPAGGACGPAHRQLASQGLKGSLEPRLGLLR